MIWYETPILLLIQTFQYIVCNKMVWPHKLTLTCELTKVLHFWISINISDIVKLNDTAHVILILLLIRTYFCIENIKMVLFHILFPVYDSKISGYHQISISNACIVNFCEFCQHVTSTCSVYQTFNHIIYRLFYQSDEIINVYLIIFQFKIYSYI